MNNKIEKQLNFTCSACFSTFQLLEIHEKESHNCSQNCQVHWEKILSKAFGEYIILHFAKEEARKEENHDS